MMVPQVSWAPPLSPNGEISSYRVLVHLGRSYHKHRGRATDKVTLSTIYLYL